MSKVIVIGGGAAGMMAAIGAAIMEIQQNYQKKMTDQAKKYLLQERADVILQMLQIFRTILLTL